MTVDLRFANNESPHLGNVLRLGVTKRDLPVSSAAWGRGESVTYLCLDPVLTSGLDFSVFVCCVVK